MMQRVGGCGCGCGHSAMGCNCSSNCAGCNCNRYGGGNKVLKLGGGGGGGGGGNKVFKPNKGRRRAAGCGLCPPVLRRYAGAVTPAQDIPAEASLESKMMALWADHGFYTYAVLVAVVNNTREKKIVEDRLMLNQDHIAYMFVSKFGPIEAEALSALLKTHIGIAAKIIGAVVNNAPELNSLQSEWNENGRQIANKLFSFQTKSGAYVLSQADWQNQMQHHLDLLTKIVVGYIAGNPTGGDPAKLKLQEAFSNVDPYIAHVRLLGLKMAKLLGPGGYPYIQRWGEGYTFTNVRPGQWPVSFDEPRIIFPPYRQNWPYNNAYLPPYRFSTPTVYYS